MADQKYLDFTYSLIDRMFRASFGEHGSFSGAKYDGDFSLTLEEAQNRKHEYIFEQLNICRGNRVLDMGCGWGPFLKFLKERGVYGTGLTLSYDQMSACQKNGLNVHLIDCRCVGPNRLGTFDGVVSLGAFEHFATKQDWQSGEQDQIYRRFFQSVHSLLKEGSRFYLQTMVFGKNMIDSEEVSLEADIGSDAYICALMQKQFPGSWLPSGLEQILDNTEAFFEPIEISSGRLDYIETQKQWKRKFREFSLKKYLFYASLIPTYALNKNFRRRVNPFEPNPNRLCFEREILDHYRIVFEKK